MDTRDSLGVFVKVTLLHFLAFYSPMPDVDFNIPEPRHWTRRDPTALSLTAIVADATIPPILAD